MPRASQQRDFEDLFEKVFDKPGHAVEIVFKRAEPRDELRSRLRQQEADAEHQRHRDRVILVAVVSVVSVVTLVCVGQVVFSGVQPETTKWSTTLLTTVVAGGVGYLTGKGSK